MAQFSGMWTLSQVAQAIKNKLWTGQPPSTIEYLVVGGGASGGSPPSFNEGGGGGGAGGVLQGISSLTAGSSYYVTVGAGGASVNGNTANGNGNGSIGLDGSASVFDSTSSGASTGRIVATGGGGGGGGGGDSSNCIGRAGGSGGGAGGRDSNLKVGGTGTSGQGNAGGNNSASTTPNYGSGGGGGAGTIGLNGQNTFGAKGGIGIASAITGAVVVYAGGGGGSTYNGGTAGLGGTGGGGAGANGSANATAGTVNTGGGGGGAGTTSSATYNSGAGGSGIVIIRYSGNQQWFTGGTLSYDSVNNYTVHSFYSSSTLTPLSAPVTYGTTSSLTKSLRFRRSNSGYLTRTPASATNQKTYTWSGWIKRGALPTVGVPIFSTAGSPYAMYLCFGGTDMTALTTDALCFFSPVSGSSFSVQSAGVYRDTSAWYHVVCAVDTTQANSTDRVKLYVNGSQVTYGTSTYPSQNLSTYINSTGAVSIGYASSSGTYFDGELAEVNFIDGQQLTPQSFGTYDATTGVWQPMTFVGTYGTNGFYLPFTNTTSTTTLGYDSSGNSNNFTTSGISLTAGSTYDSMLDVPTLSSTASNYATLNPNFKANTTTNYDSITNGNLTATGTSNTDSGTLIGTMAQTTGKWYWEVTISSLSSGYIWIGAIDSNNLVSTSGAQSTGYLSLSYAYQSATGNKINNNSSSAYGSSFTTGDVIGVALDCTNGAIYFSKNGTFQNSGVPTSGASKTGAAYTWTGGNQNMIPQNEVYTTGASASLNFGQQSFIYTPPSGYVALNTYNLPTPAIVQGNTAMNAITYTGNGTSNRIITTGLQSDFVWIKRRDAAVGHLLFDVIRGAGRTIRSESTDAESNDGSYYVQQFNSNNFLIGNSDTAINALGSTYVSWVWKANGSVSAGNNTSGSITSTVSANTTSGFSVVTYTGTGANATVGHGLGVAPKMIIVKHRNAVDIWPVYHESIGNTQYLRLQGSNAAATFNLWQNTSPTSSVFYISTDTTVNTSTGTYVAYCFAQISGFSAIGSYVGNGSNDGPFIYTGFRPKFILTKDTTTSSYWWEMVDSARSPYNTSSIALYANVSDAEYNSANYNKDLLSNGFKIRNGNGGDNTSGSTYIYMAFAENPFRNALAR